MKKKKIEKPKVFISYAWSSKEYDVKVISFASRLMGDGIEVLLDKWNIDPGADTVNFMEKCVKDESVNYVLMLLDKKHVDKADRRKGGVGIETQIISNVIIYRYLSSSSFTNEVYSISVLSSASNKHNGGNNTHHQLSPLPSPNVITNDS